MTGNIGYGQQTPADANSDYNVIAFMVRQMMSRLATMMPVQVVAVHGGAGALAAAGTVDVQPLVTMLDGNGHAMNHGVLAQCSYFRLQGGANAIILDPVVGDIGFAVFAMRDISSVTAVKGIANPGSGRQYDMADGIYVGGVLNGVPTQYIAFTAEGIEITAATITLNGAIVFNGTVSNTSGTLNLGNNNITTTGAISGGAIASNGHNVGSTHIHSGVTTGGGDTGPPL